MRQPDLHLSRAGTSAGQGEGDPVAAGSARPAVGEEAVDPDVQR
ncbi:hypothetical protein ABTY00_30525 [Streptomyces microflavus]